MRRLSECSETHKGKFTWNADAVRNATRMIESIFPKHVFAILPIAQSRTVTSFAAHEGNLKVVATESQMNGVLSSILL